jgi:hypothetical protein
VVGSDGRQRRGTVRFRRFPTRRFNARKQDLAAIGKMKAAAVDDIGNAAFALMRQPASLRAHRSI